MRRIFRAPLKIKKRSMNVSRRTVPSARQQLLFDVLALHHATADISHDAVRLLVALINLAAVSEGTSIPVVLGKLRPGREIPQRIEKLAACFAELRLRGLVRPVEGDVYEIAPTLWKVGTYRAGGRWFAATNGK